MAIKHFILALLAIQAVNGAAIKPKSLKQEFDDIIMWIRIHAWSSSGLHDQLGYTFINSNEEICNITEQVSTTGAIAFKQIEELFSENAEWSIVCFEGMQDKVALVNGDLSANTEKCIQETEVTVKEFQQEAINMDKLATKMAEALTQTWEDCNDDEGCQETLVTGAQKALDALTVEFLRFKGRIEGFIYSGFPELQSCLDSYYEKVHLEKLVDIMRPVYICLQENNPNSN